MNRKIKFLLLTAIFISGFCSLATELIVIRQLSTFVGTTVVTTAIIIGCIMSFMAWGYYHGSTVSLTFLPVRKKIYSSFIRLACFLILASSFVLLAAYFSCFYFLHIQNAPLRTFLFCLIFLSFPAYFFGNITSLLCRYLHKYNRNYTGRILAVDTLGSVLGSLLSTLVLMPFIGVNYTIVFLVVLCILTASFFAKKFHLFTWIFIPLIALILNHSLLLEKIFGIVENNAVSTIAILNVDKGKSKLMILNDTFASKISQDENLLFQYVVFIENQFIKTLPKNKKHKILVLGAGGFTMGKDDVFNDYTYVDIDNTIKFHAEKHFLGIPLSNNKKFVAHDANQFLNENSEKFDLVILDSYSSITPSPSLITHEYFSRVKNHVADGGIMVANIATKPNFSDKYALKIDNTLRSVFITNLHSQIIDKFNPWDTHAPDVNIVYTWYNFPNEGNIYTINKNTLPWDR